MDYGAIHYTLYLGVITIKRWISYEIIISLFLFIYLFISFIRVTVIKDRLKIEPQLIAHLVKNECAY